MISIQFLWIGNTKFTNIKRFVIIQNITSVQEVFFLNQNKLTIFGSLKSSGDY